MSFSHARWYVNVAKWRPTKDEWLKLTSSIAQEELERINKFVFQDDCKSSLIGCALIRKFLTEATKTASNEIVLTRTQHGRPEVSEAYRRSKAASWPPVIDFNVSHSGDFCVLAGVWAPNLDAKQPDIRIGVDVTKIVSKNSKQELDRFLDLMSRRPFTRAEWDSVEKATNDRQKCINFTRLWCLKESFIKAIGLGMTFRLQRIDFEFSARYKYHISTQVLRQRLMGDTSVLLDGQPAPDWRFYETALDGEHIVALGYNAVDSSSIEQVELRGDIPFEEVPIDSIVSSLTPMCEANEAHWTSFSAKGLKPLR